MRDKACFPEVVRDDRERERRGGVREKGEMERETKLERLPRTTFTCTSVIWLLCVGAIWVHVLILCGTLDGAPF